MIDEKIKDKVSNLFKVISDPTRIMILFALKDEEMTVTKITEVLNMSQSAVSHQLRILRDAKLVINTKIGKEVFYRLADNHVHLIFNQAIEHVCE